MEFKGDRFAKGLEIRRSVLGKDHVDASLARSDDFNAILQQLVTEFCWGDIWSRNGLDRRIRSMLNLAMLTALNRPHEFRLHVRGAVSNGVTRSEIQEVLLQTAPYCGIPASLEAFKLAAEVFREIDANGGAANGDGSARIGA
jgi:4-carboxymuconolactone decarboxylase